MRQPIFKIILTVFFTFIISLGVFYVWQNQALNSSLLSAGNQSEATSLQPNMTNEIREILPRGYVIADQLFFSPALGLSFTGQLKTLEFKDNKFRAQDWPGVIQVFQKKSGQDIIDAIKEIVKKEGKNPDDCSFDIVTQNNENAIVEVKAQKAYEPTEAELFALRKKQMPELKTLSDYRKYCGQSPECGWNKASLIQDFNQKSCSAYAVSTRYHDGSYFQFSTEGNGSDTFLYVHDEVGGGDRSWIEHVDLLVNY
jgi:hypothetical protein